MSVLSFSVISILIKVSIISPPIPSSLPAGFLPLPSLPLLLEPCPWFRAACARRLGQLRLSSASQDGSCHVNCSTAHFSDNKLVVAPQMFHNVVLFPLSWNVLPFPRPHVTVKLLLIKDASQMPSSPVNSSVPLPSGKFQVSLSFPCALLKHKIRKYHFSSTIECPGLHTNATEEGSHV